MSIEENNETQSQIVEPDVFTRNSRNRSLFTSKGPKAGNEKGKLRGNSVRQLQTADDSRART